ARSARVLGDHGAGDFALKRLIDRRGRNPVELLRADHGNVVRRVQARHGRRRTGDNLGFQLQHVTGQSGGDVLVPGSDRDVLLYETNSPDAEGYRTIRRGEGETALIVSVAANRCSDDVDTGSDERFTASLDSDTSADAARLRKCAGTDEQQQQQ